jgi:phage baseplate assembly protein W/LysM repeat protein
MAAPLIVSIQPQAAQVGDPPVTMIVRGSDFTTDTVVNFGGQAMTTSFVDSTFVMATVPTSAFPQTSLGGVTVNVSNSVGASNSSSFAISKPSPVSMQDVLDVANAINTSTFTLPSLVNNPYVKSITNVDTYLVRDGDTLQSIATALTGNAEGWMDIAQLNNLRYPYISTDPEELQGQINTSLYLTRRAHAGDTVVYINGVTQLVQAGTLLFFNLQSPLSNGQLTTLSDVVAIISIVRDNIPAQSRVIINSPLLNTYDAGTKVDVLNTANNTTSRVISPGQFLLVPSSEANSSIVKNRVLNMNDVYAMLGQDIRLDVNGLLGPDGNGDIQTVVGVDNLSQAMWHRLVTENGQLVYHPTYGNPLIDYIGSVNTPTLAVLANHQIQQVLLADPRVNSIQTISTTVQGDTLNISVVVNVDLLSISSQFNFVITNQ